MVNWTIDGGVDNRVDNLGVGVPQIERIRVETYEGDDRILVNLAETLTDATPYTIDGGPNDPPAGSSMPMVSTNSPSMAGRRPVISAG